MASKVPRHTRNRQNTQYAVPSTVASSLVWAVGTGHWAEETLEKRHFSQITMHRLGQWRLRHWDTGQQGSRAANLY